MRELDDIFLNPQIMLGEDIVIDMPPAGSMFPETNPDVDSMAVENSKRPHDYNNHKYIACYIRLHMGMLTAKNPTIPAEIIVDNGLFHCRAIRFIFDGTMPQLTYESRPIDIINLNDVTAAINREITKYLGL